MYFCYGSFYVHLNLLHALIASFHYSFFFLIKYPRCFLLKLIHVFAYRIELLRDELVNLCYLILELCACLL